VLHADELKMEENKTIGITSKIQAITCNNFKLAAIKPADQKKLDKDKFAFEFNMNIKMEPIKNEVIIHSLTKIYAEDSKEFYLGEIETTGIFELHNFQEITKAYNGMMPNGVLSMFIGVLLSTTRGILLVKSEGTFLSGALMPIINTGSFFTNPETIVKK